jgi:tRNA (cmo5U34)-methyltransferase
MKDELFKDDFGKKFEFNEAVASVFDDMISRSIPFYDEFLSFSVDVIGRFCPAGASVVDFGCSTANTLLALHRKYPTKYELIGIDTSEHMLSQAHAKAVAYGASLKLYHADLFECDIFNAGCVVSNFVMQFIEPAKRTAAFAKAYQILGHGGVFVFAEKLTSENTPLEEFLTERYYEYKRKMGYSELEIMQKRQALENVLIPFGQAQNIQLSHEVGFTHTECVFRAMNFALFVAFKA